MAKLRVTPEVLLQALFPDRVDLVLHGAFYDWRDGIVLLDLGGSCVPDVPEVVAEITVQSRSTVFKPKGQA